MKFEIKIEEETNKIMKIIRMVSQGILFELQASSLNKLKRSVTMHVANIETNIF